MSGYPFSSVPFQQIVKNSGFAIISFLNPIKFIVCYVVFIVGKLLRQKKLLRSKEPYQEFWFWYYTIFEFY